jgi:hypothetical protein
VSDLFFFTSELPDPFVSEVGRFFAGMIDPV